MKNKFTCFRKYISANFLKIYFKRVFEKCKIYFEHQFLKIYLLGFAVFFPNSENIFRVVSQTFDLTRLRSRQRYFFRKVMPG